MNQDEVDTSTPQSLIDEIKSINHLMFDEFTEYKSLTHYITEITKKHNCPYFAFLTGSSRTIQVFKCKYGGNKKGATSPKTDCRSYIKFVTEKDGSFSFNSAEFEHNHPTNKFYFASHFNILTEKQIEDARNQQKLGVPPGQIRTNLDTPINSNIFYEIRRQTIKDAQKETLKSFKKETDFRDFYSEIQETKDNQFCSCVFVHGRIAKSQFSYDFASVDDTAGTNIYDLPLEVMLVIDADGKSQVLAFGLLQDRSEQSYQHFFNVVKSQMSENPKFFSSDRSQAQINAIKCIFPNALIIFCRVHLRRDLLKFFEPSDTVIIGFDFCYNHPEKCDNYIEILKEKINHVSEEARNLLNYLLNNCDNWLPSKLIEHGVFINQINNRVEGFFGNFKLKYGFTRFSANRLCQCLKNYSELLLVQSQRSIQKTLNHYKEFPLFDISDIAKIGLLALEIISKEYACYLNADDNAPHCVWRWLRKNKSDLALPCRHLMNNAKHKYSLSDVSPRFIRCPMINQAQDHTVTTINKNVKKTFSDIMAKIYPYAAAAPRIPEVMEIFDRTLDELDSVTSNIELNNGMPKTLAIQGRLSAHPSHNVVFGGERMKKKVYCCSICHQPGHNAASCPNK